MQLNMTCLRTIGWWPTARRRVISTCLLQRMLYKGLFVLILVFVALEYLYNTISDTRNSIFNATKSSEYFDKSFISYGPLFKTLLFKNHVQNGTNVSAVIHANHLNPIIYSKTGNFSINMSNLNYVIKMPPFLLGDMTSAYSTVASSTPVIATANFRDNGTNTFRKPLCPDISQYLDGRVQIRKYPVPSVQTLESRFPWLQPGGHGSPLNCTVDKKVAIVIPFRNREENLLLFLQHMHPFLKKQQIDYTIFVIEQDNEGPFNKAMLMNIGYVEALKMRRYDCFIFHDVDLLPEDDRNLYTCPKRPRHMSVAVSKFKYRLLYPWLFGGVTALSTEHFKLLNGFSNSFWGWGGEDDDMTNRLRYHHLYISRYPITIARYTMLMHKKTSRNPKRHCILSKGQKLFDKDGLNNLTYDLLMKKENLLYSWILVKLKPPLTS